MLDLHIHNVMYGYSVLWLCTLYLSLGTALPQSTEKHYCALRWFAVIFCPIYAPSTSNARVVIELAHRHIVDYMRHNTEYLKSRLFISKRHIIIIFQLG